MMICPYCKQEIPSKDFAAKTPQGNYWHFNCADSALDDWVKVKEANDQQRDSIQKLSAQVVGLREVLVDYPYGPPESASNNPECECIECQWLRRRDIILSQPDPGAEIRERLLEAESYAEIIDGRMGRLLKAWQEAHPDAHYWPDLGDNFDWMMERMKKLEAVAEALRNYRKFASVYCDQQENIAWHKIEQALAALGDRP